MVKSERKNESEGRKGRRSKEKLGEMRKNGTSQSITKRTYNQTGAFKESKKDTYVKEGKQD